MNWLKKKNLRNIRKRSREDSSVANKTTSVMFVIKGQAVKMKRKLSKKLPN